MGGNENMGSIFFPLKAAGQGLEDCPLEADLIVTSITGYHQCLV